MDHLEVEFSRAAAASDTIAVAFGMRLRSLREGQHRHIATMARDLVMSAESLELLEAGMQEPDLLLLSKIAHCLGISISTSLEDL